jgi:hypothetical protein
MARADRRPDGNEAASRVQALTPIPGAVIDLRWRRVGRSAWPKPEAQGAASHWKDTEAPRRLAAAKVQALLDSCDRATGSGKGTGRSCCSLGWGCGPPRWPGSRRMTSTGGPVSWSWTARPGAVTRCPFQLRWERRLPPTCSKRARGSGSTDRLLDPPPPERLGLRYPRPGR